MVFYDVLMISPVIKIRLGEENLNYWKPAWLTEMEAARSESGHIFWVLKRLQYLFLERGHSFTLFPYLESVNIAEAFPSNNGSPVQVIFMYVTINCPICFFFLDIPRNSPAHPKAKFVRGHRKAHSLGTK